MASETSKAGYAGCAMNQEGRLMEDECFILNHVSMFGAEGYPISRIGTRRWSWQYRSSGCPISFPTKKQAIFSFERHLKMLRMKLSGQLS